MNLLIFNFFASLLMDMHGLNNNESGSEDFHKFVIYSSKSHGTIYIIIYTLILKCTCLCIGVKLFNFGDI